jgi:hypothetical protein
MKNIHVLPTDKPSRLWRNNLLQGKLELSDELLPYNTSQNIYITSDEFIEEDNFGLNISTKEIVKYNGVKGLNSYYKKIILTTDDQLIKDGVQAIDDEFLEWFVKNPSCESVEVERFHGINTSIAEVSAVSGNDDYNWKGIGDFRDYRIIIPKEEPKQIYYNTVGIENGVNVVKGQFNTQKEALDLANELNRKFPDLYYDWRETLIKEEPKQNCKHDIVIKYGVAECQNCGMEENEITKEEPKQPYNNLNYGGGFTEEDIKRVSEKNTIQETLEEAAANESEYLADWEDKDMYQKGFIAGAKWQAERMYSEEEVYRKLHNLMTDIKLYGVVINDDIDLKKWFEQFKKKQS